MRIQGTRLDEISQKAPCARCGHPLSRHVGPELGSWCNVARQSANDWKKAPACFCDGYVWNGAKDG